MNDDKVLMGHGSGGVMMKEIIEDVFFEAYGGRELLRGDDAAILEDLVLRDGERIAFSSDSFVVDPHFFPGGDIGRLAVCGTVNDVSTSGARPEALSVSFVLEEGYPISQLRKVCASIADASKEAGVRVVTGDTKVVERGKADGIYINTSGVGVVPAGVSLSGANCRPGDVVIVSGTLGDHGITIMSQREGLSFSANVESDVAPLNAMVAKVLEVAPETRCFRDPTRGGLASTLNEFASQSNVDITVEQEKIPMNSAVEAACEMLGYDPLQVANEGKLVCVTPPFQGEAVVKAMRASKYGKNAEVIGTVAQVKSGRSPKVFVQTAFGTRRVLDQIIAHQLPRIC